MFLETNLILKNLDNMISKFKKDDKIDMKIDKNCIKDYY
jgi:hypothetical protein